MKLHRRAPDAHGVVDLAQRQPHAAAQNAALPQEGDKRRDSLRRAQQFAVEPFVLARDLLDHAPMVAQACHHVSPQEADIARGCRIR